VQQVRTSHTDTTHTRATSKATHSFTDHARNQAALAAQALSLVWPREPLPLWTSIQSSQADKWCGATQHASSGISQRALPHRETLAHRYDGQSALFISLSLLNLSTPHGHDEFSCNPTQDSPIIMLPLRLPPGRAQHGRMMWPVPAATHLSFLRS